MAVRRSVIAVAVRGAILDGRHFTATHVILGRFASDAFRDPRGLKQIAATVAEKIKVEYPAVTWKGSYLTLGRFDV